MTVFIYVSVQLISYSYKPEAAGGSFQLFNGTYKKSIHLFMRKILPSRAAGDQRKLKESEY